jgi:hypothetical protein
MSIPLTGTAGFFTRVGLLGGGVDAVNTGRGATLSTRLKDIHDQYLAVDQAVVDQLFTQGAAFRTLTDFLPKIYQSDAKNTLIEMAWDDKVIKPKDLPTAMDELIRQMDATADSVLKPTVTGTVAAGSGNIGTGKAIVSVLDHDGVQMDYVVPEVVTARVTEDAVHDGLTAGEELFLIKGQLDNGNPLAYDWPKGSSAEVEYITSDPSLDADDLCLLTNGGFEEFTVADTPDNWPISVGTAGVTIFEGTGASNIYRGGSSLEFRGTAGLVLDEIYQQFDISTGTLGVLAAGTVYGVNLFHKVSAVPAAGVLKIELTDGTGTVVNDNAGTPNVISQTLSTSTTSFTPIQGFFRTPTVLPAALRIRIRLTTAIDDGKSVFFDDACVVEGQQLYAGGPYVAIFRGSANFVDGDFFTFTMANDYVTLGKWQFLADRFFGMRALGVQLPSVAAGNTIAEGLVV